MSDTWERVQLASARVPFRVKTGAVWVVLFLLLGFVGNAAGFDVQWIRDHLHYILGGLRYTMTIAIGGIALAVVMALMGALARISRNPVAYGVAGFYVSFFRGTPLIVQMFLLYLALPPKSSGPPNGTPNEMCGYTAPTKLQNRICTSTGVQRKSQM